MTRGAIAIACVLAAAAAAAAARAEEGAPVPAEDVASVEVAVPRDVWYVGEPVPVTLRIEADETFLRARGLQPFQRPLDVPFQVSVPWLVPPDGWTALPGPSPPDGPSRRTLSLNGAVAVLRRTGEVAGTEVSALETTRTIVATRPGEHAPAANVLRFSYGTAYRDDLLAGSVATGSTDAEVASTSPALRVLPLPEEGRPEGFTGAVGRFTVSAAADRTLLQPGQSVRVTVSVTGEGDTSLFDTPRFDGVRGFHVVGTIDDRGRAGRTIVCELAPLPGADPPPDAVPPLRFPCFDTTPPAGWRVLQTAPLPLRVLAPSGDGPRAPSPAGGARGAGRMAVWILAGAAAVAAAAVAAHRRRRRASLPGAQRTLRDDADEAAARLAGPGADPGAELAEFLARGLGCAPAAVIAGDLAARLAAAGVPDALAARAAASMERLVAARYGGGDAGPAASEVARLLRDVAASLDAAPPRR